MRVHFLNQILAWCLALGITGSLAAQDTGSAWSGITVDVKSDVPVATSQTLQAQGHGFQRLSITLSNPGAQPAKIEKIVVHIPFGDPLKEDQQVVYGGSCMGRTPLLRQNVGKSTAASSSFMYEMVQLAGDSYLFAGSLSWRIFLPNFTLKKNAIDVWSDGESRQLNPGESIQYEQIVLRRADNWLNLLNEFGAAIAAENSIGTLKPADYKGWATWDYYGRVFSARDIYGNMDVLNKIAPEANMIQIDGGWWTERGDYTSIRPDLLPGGLKEIVSRINSEGKTAGIHFDGFRGDENSQVYKSHPDYFLHDLDGKLIVDVDEKSDRVMRYIYFDYSNPGALAHIADCIRYLKETCGIRYFKIDFMRYGLKQYVLGGNKSAHGIKAFDPGITSVERFRRAMDTMRKAIGPDGYFLGCSAVFGPCIGFVDGMRTGGDIHPRYEAFPERSLANLGNFYLSGKVFNGDLDYLVFREAADEDASVSKEGVKHGGKMTMNEARMWADLQVLYGTARLHSDNLMTLRPERQALIKDVFQYPAMEETVPLDLWRHGKAKNDGFELVLAHKGSQIYLGVFNWSTEAKEYDLGPFASGKAITLDGRHSQILPYAGKLSFGELTKQMIGGLK